MVRGELSFHRLATGGYVLGTRIACCRIVAIRCQAVVRVELSLHRLATGGYVLGTCIVGCGIVAIRCQAVDSVAS